MPVSLDQILPSLEALGMWAYWIIGLASMMEAFFLAGILVPGTLVVDAGGIMVQQGALDFFDLVWFVAIGSALGSQLGYLAGRLARRGMDSRWEFERSRSYRKAEGLLRRHGGLAMVLGRLTGPVSGMVPIAAALLGMDPRRFLLWNIASSFVYGLAHVGLGYLVGDALSRIGPVATRAALIAGLLAVLLALLWWLVVRIARSLPFVLSVLRSIAQAIASNDDVKAWAARHPKLAQFIAHRFDTSRPSGLTATLLGALFLYLAAVWVGSVLDRLTASPVVQADMRLARLIQTFWTPALLKAAAHVTALGDWRVVASLMGAALVFLWLRRRPDLMLGLVASVGGNVLAVAVLKRLFHRPRPELAYFVETSGSFPSGHAAISVAFYGMVCFAAWRLKLLGPVVAALMATSLAFVIGLSRLYLIEHYLSDVLNGWLVGAMWLLIGIALAEWWRATRPRPPTPTPWRLRLAASGLAATLCILAAWQVATYDKARNVPVPVRADQTVTDIAGLFTSGKVPVTTESIVGTPLEPINVLFLAASETVLADAMDKAGWTKAARSTLGSLARAAWSLVIAEDDVSAPVTPYFWDGLPNDLAWQKPTADRTLAKRHHVRVWRSRFVTPDGLRLFVAAASCDDGLDWQLLHHIDPDVDAERDALAADLEAAGVVDRRQMLQLSRARLGQSVAGDPWFTDGRAIVLVLKSAGGEPEG